MWGRIRRLITILLTVVALFFVFGLILSKLGIVPPTGSKEPPKFLDRFTVQQSDYFADIAHLPSCSSNNELFTEPPIALTDFNEITPLGLLSPTAHVFPAPHLYLRIKTVGGQADGLPVEVPVVAPAKLTVTNVKYIEANNKPEFNDGFVSFGVCREFKAYFDHLKTFSPKIQDAFDKAKVQQCSRYSLSYQSPIGTVDYELCQKRVKVELEKGEAIGTAGGGEGQKAFDFGAVDQRIQPAVFAKPERWATRKQWAYAVCPLDYYQEPLKSQLKSRLGGETTGGKVSSLPCGEVVQDKVGTALGVWVAPGTDEIEHDPPHLALVKHHLEIDKLAFSVGDGAAKGGLNMGLYTFQPKESGSINRHFGTLSADNLAYCYETDDRYNWQRGSKVAILISMPSEETLRIQKYSQDRCGDGPWVLDQPAEFVR